MNSLFSSEDSIEEKQSKIPEVIKNLVKQVYVDPNLQKLLKVNIKALESKDSDQDE